MQRVNHIIRRQFTQGVGTARKNIVVVDGVRIPFAMSGTVYNDYMAVDLARFALKGLLVKTAIDPNLIDYVLMGTVIQEARTSNIAREAAMGAGLPINIPSNTVTQACISANQAITTGAEKILAGEAEIIIAGGTETASDVPIRFSRPIRKRLMQVPKTIKKGPLALLGLTKGLKAGDFAPEAPSIANFTTGEVMGHSSDRLAAKFGVTRQEQDEFAVMSHKRAAAAHAAGLYKEELVAVNGNVTENGIKGDSSVDKISKLAPAFIKPHGTATAANSSFLTDGAAMSLIMSEEKALALGYKPKAYIRAWDYVAVDPFEELLLGPTYAVHRLLKNAGLKLSDIGVIEMHEAFAGQVLANMNAMSSAKFAQEKLDGNPVGRFDYALMNTLGGSLSLGHPFGATGSRLVTTASNRLQREQKRFAILAACADGGLAHSCLLERYDNK